MRQGCDAIPEDADFPTTLAELLLKEGQEEKVVLILKQLELLPELAEATKSPADPAQPMVRPNEAALRAAASAGKRARSPGGRHLSSSFAST